MKLNNKNQENTESNKVSKPIFFISEKPINKMHMKIKLFIIVFCL